jgi:Na+/H+ antiporter NhaD/arsenite permease-like protein
VDTWIAAAVFLATYAIIATERLDRTVAALAGGAAMVILGIVTQEEALAAVELDVILLLVSMMVIAGVLRETGFFQWIAIRSVHAAGGDPIRLLIVLALVTAVLSAFLDNVTTVVLIAPVTLFVAATLGVSPIPFLIAQILASNIGGAATLVGDPPNILIGAATGLDFVDFLLNMAPVAIVVLVASLAWLGWVLRRSVASSVDVDAALASLDADQVITDVGLLRRSLLVLGLTIVGFLLGGTLGLEPATIALTGATVLLLVTSRDIHGALDEVEWPTIAFFVGLFIVVEGIVAVGIVERIADVLLELTGSDPALTTIGLLWFSGIASAIIDNIPYTATMIPVVFELGNAGIPIEPLWWALALGACLGGNATIVGASANVVASGMSARAGHPISFRTFVRYGIPVTVLSLAISSVYVWMRYLT